jgi:branched-chain amino acid transport system substrate-binding protein
MKRFYFISFVLILAILPLPALAQDTVKIGCVLPYTGALAWQGQETYRGVQLAAEMQNKRGGVHGKKVVLVKGDAETLKTAVTETERLISMEGIKIFAGWYSSSRAKVATTVTEKYGAIACVVIAVADDITERGYKYVFQPQGRASLWGELSAEFVAKEAAPKLGKKPGELRVAIAYEDSDFGTSISVAFARKAKEYQMNIVAQEPYSLSALDLSPVVLRIKQANPDVLALTPYVRDGILFLQQAKDAGLSPKVLICPGGPLANDVFGEKLGDDMNYMLVTTCASHDVRKEAFKPEAWAALQEFVEGYTKEFKKPPTNDAYHGFQGAWTFFHFGLPQAKSLTPDDIEKSMRSLVLKPGENITTFGYQAAPAGHKNAGANLIGYPNVFQWQKGSVGHLVYPKEFAKSQLMLPMPAWGQRGMK